MAAFDWDPGGDTWDAFVAASRIGDAEAWYFEAAVELAVVTDLPPFWAMMKVQFGQTLTKTRADVEV